MSDQNQYGPVDCLAEFRHDVHALGDTPSREELEDLLRRAHELGAADRGASGEVDLVRGYLAAAKVQEQIDAGILPVVEQAGPMVSGVECHFAAAVRFGRRRADQFGHLLLTANYIRFHGAMDVSITWGGVSEVKRDGREIVVWLHRSRRLLRFWCHSYAEAASGVVIANHLKQAAHHVEYEPPARQLPAMT